MDNNKSRGRIILAMVFALLIAIVIRLFDLQILSEEYRGMADNRVKRVKVIVPPRGNVYDRNDVLYVKNSPTFDMRIVPVELAIPDTQVIAKHLGISNKEIQHKILSARKVSPYREFVVAQYIDPQTYSKLQERTWNFNGIHFNMVSKRAYVYPIGANFMGYIGEVDSVDIKRAPPGTFNMGDLIGKSGIERSYDSLLRGIPGRQVVLKDVFSREVGVFDNGNSDKPAKRGADIQLGIDVELQALGEELMQNKIGSIVAIEPKTGDILAFVSSPTYDPNLLTGGRDFAANWRRLTLDTLKSLLNRPIMGSYPPGSIFKIPAALAALNEGVITAETSFSCGGGFWRNKGKPGCRVHPPLRLTDAITHSCNVYFAETYVNFLNNRRYANVYEGFNKWKEYMELMGAGVKLDIDLPYEKPGRIPSVERYDKWYGKDRWGAMTTISNSIGQGEIEMTPLQMAHMAAIVANRGYYYKPHLVKAIRQEGDKKWVKKEYLSNKTKIDRRHFDVVVDAMERVVLFGTASRAYIDDSIVVCGKTGTVQNSKSDHSVFIGFAPKFNPRIAIAVIIENVGAGGGAWAAPTGSVMIEKFIRRKIVKKQYEYERVKNANFMPSHKPKVYKAPIPIAQAVPAAVVLSE